MFVIAHTAFGKEFFINVDNDFEIEFETATKFETREDAETFLSRMKEENWIVAPVSYIKEIQE